MPNRVPTRSRHALGPARKAAPTGIQKTATGIQGLDEITGGGLPKGRPTLICGGPGCGKTLLAMEFLVRGTAQFNEPGVFMAFEESEEELTQNVASLGFDLKRLAAKKKVMLDYVRVERSEIQETGEFDLEGLFVRLNHAIETIGAKRVVLDTIEGLFAGLPNEAIVRAELRRLFRWLKDKGVTALITAERGEGRLTRYGLEEYVADCVIVLDHRVIDQVSTRRLRVLKYRGSRHGTNEYPFLIGADGLSVLPITSLALDHPAPTQRVSTGVPGLDAMFGGRGYYRGSSVLISGTAGAGKSSFAAAFAHAGCRRGERCLFLSYEESPEQILRNMGSIGLDLRPWVQKGLLRFHNVRPHHFGLETHLVRVHDQIEQFKPRLAVLDPITNLIAVAEQSEVKGMLTRLIDFLKTRAITAVFTSLTLGESHEARSEVGISSLMDTWLLLRNVEQAGERNRALYVLKSRGMSHSNQIREFSLSRDGIELVDVLADADQILTGSARLAQQARLGAETAAREQRISRLRRDAVRKRKAVQAQIAVLQSALEADVEEITENIEQEARGAQALSQERAAMARRRMGVSDAARSRRTGNTQG